MQNFEQVMNAFHAAKMDHLQRVAPLMMLDANETVFFARQLEQIEAKIYEYDIPRLKYREKIPVDNTIDPGAIKATYTMTQGIGKAAYGKGAYSRDLPKSDVKSEQFSQNIYGCTSSFEYTVDEIRAAAFANVPLEALKQNNARRAIMQQESAVAMNGDIPTALEGLIDNPNITSTAAAKVWSTASALEMVADVAIMVNTIRANSKGTREADTLLLPIDQYNLLATTPLGNDANKTVLNFIMDPNNSFGLVDVDWLPFELINAFTGGTEDGAICYEKNPDVLQQRIPLEMLIHAVQTVGFTFIFPVESRHGGTVIRYPHAIMQFTGI